MDRIEDVILFQIDKTSKVSKLFSQREFDRLKIDITVEQWIILKIIQESSPLSQKELATKSNRNPSSITRTLDLLERKSFLKREPIPENRRQYNIVLTKAGTSFVKKHIKIIEAQRILSVKGFSQKEVEKLKSMLKRIQANLE